MTRTCECCARSLHVRRGGNVGVMVGCGLDLRCPGADLHPVSCVGCGSSFPIHYSYSPVQDWQCVGVTDKFRVATENGVLRTIPTQDSHGHFDGAWLCRWAAEHRLRSWIAHTNPVCGSGRIVRAPGKRF